MYHISLSLEQTKPNIGGVDLPADDSTWLSAKYLLNQTAKGRQIVLYTEQNIKTDSIYYPSKLIWSKKTIAKPWPKHMLMTLLNF